MAYDVIVLGSGPGGYPAAIRASQLGFKVAIIEKESLGGVCLNWGCIPTKALLKSSQVYEYAKHGSAYGINISGAQQDFGGVIKRSRGVADKMSRGVQFLMKKNKIDVIMGFGKLTGKGTIEVKLYEGLLDVKKQAISEGVEDWSEATNKYVRINDSVIKSEQTRGIITSISTAAKQETADKQEVEQEKRNEHDGNIPTKGQENELPDSSLRQTSGGQSGSIRSNNNTNNHYDL